MIRLFVSDIDGCLADPYKPFELDQLERLSTLSTIAGAPGDHPDFPAVSICSGRAYPYVEAMSQLLGLVTPVLFEAGAGMFDPVEARSEWHPDFTDDVRAQVDEVRHYLEGLVAGTIMSIDYAKRSQAALVCTDDDLLNHALEKITVFVEDGFPDLCTYHTHISIDIVPNFLSKRVGMTWLADICGVETDEIAFIGDTNGDIGALKLVGASFAPANAQTGVKDVVQHVCAGRSVHGVMEAYGRCVEANKRERGSP